MGFLAQILGVAAGFSAIMLTCSLVVMSLVRIVHYLQRRRGNTLGEMLGALSIGFRSSHADAAEPGDAAQVEFTLDVLAYPALHSPETVRRTMSPVISLSGTNEQRARLARDIEYISVDDLIRIVQQYSALERGATNANDKEAALWDIPARWHVALPAEARKVGVFTAYIKDWFATVEGASAERFKIAARRLTITVSCILVVLLNLDGIALLSTLYKSGAVRDELANRSTAILAMADRLKVHSTETALPTNRDALLDGVSTDLLQLNTVLNQPELAIGWQASWISKEWCAYQGKCASGDGALKKSRKEWVIDVFRWLAGLTLSGTLLSLGAPFWTTQLRDVLNLQNSVRQAKGAVAKVARRDGDDEDDSPTPSGAEA
jgi:hypothetical protein